MLLSTKTPTPIRLIRMLFMMLCGVVLVALAMLFLLKIHETVNADQGEIIAENAPVEYVTPYEAEVKKVWVQEGDKVEIGDKLITLYSAAAEALVKQTEQDLKLAKEQVYSLRKLNKNLKSQEGTRRRAADNLEQNHSYQKENTSLELQALQTQVSQFKNKLKSARKRLQVDQDLLAQGLMSEAQYLDNQQVYAQEQQRFSDLNKRYLQAKANQGNLNNDRSTRLNAQELNVLSTQYERINAEKTLTEAKANLEQLKQQLIYQKEALEKSIVVADKAGYVSRLFNSKRDIKLVPKGKPLLTITPQAEEKFYAKFRIPQAAVKDVKAGQVAQIRLDAYNYYQYGVLEGEVIHIDRDTANSFYALAVIPEQETEIELKNGFAAKGKIITNKVRLSTFVYKKMFEK